MDKFTLKRWLEELSEKTSIVGPDEMALEPRRPAAIAMLAVGLLYLTLPDSIAFVSRWLPLVFGLVLLVPLVLTRRYGLHKANHILGVIYLTMLTTFMVLSLILAAHALLHRLESPAALLRAAVTLWFTNVIVFGSWYWRLDAGGPHGRAVFYGHRRGAFLFPQMLLGQADLAKQGLSDWSPGFVDYLFVAFNISTAFSPTDTPIISGWAKVLTMLQAMISLSILAFLGARAVNIL